MDEQALVLLRILLISLCGRLLTGNPISIAGGVIWRRKLLILQNLGLRQCGFLHQHSHYLEKVS